MLSGYWLGKNRMPARFSAARGRCNERLEEEKQALATDIKEVYAEAKSHGFDVKIMRQVVRPRKMDRADLAEQEELLALIEAAIMKGLGMRAGVPDLVIMWNRTHDNSVIRPGRIGFIENKRQNGGRLSPDQVQWLTALNTQRHHTAIVKNFEEFLQTLGHWDILSDKESQ